MFLLYKLMYKYYFSILTLFVNCIRHVKRMNGFLWDLPCGIYQVNTKWDLLSRIYWVIYWVGSTEQDILSGIWVRSTEWRSAELGSTHDLSGIYWVGSTEWDLLSDLLSGIYWVWSTEWNILSMIYWVGSTEYDLLSGIYWVWSTEWNILSRIYWVEYTEYDLLSGIYWVWSTELDLLSMIYWVVVYWVEIYYLTSL